MQGPPKLYLSPETSCFVFHFSNTINCNNFWALGGKNLEEIDGTIWKNGGIFVQCLCELFSISGTIGPIREFSNYQIEVITVWILTNFFLFFSENNTDFNFQLFIPLICIFKCKKANPNFSLHLWGTSSIQICCKLFCFT